jgi:hypothetical protein
LLGDDQAPDACPWRACDRFRAGCTVEHPSPAGGLDGGSDQCSEAGSLVIADCVALDVPRVKSRRNLARQRRLSAASAADHHDPLRDRPGGDRARRHAHDGTPREAGPPKPADNLACSSPTWAITNRHDGTAACALRATAVRIADLERRV